MEWKIKRFNQLSPLELYDILKAREEVFIMEQECLYHDIDSKDLEAIHIFAQEDNQVACYLRVLDKGVSYDEISIGRVMTRPAYRGQGYGEQVMEKAIDYVEGVMGESKIRISAQVYLERFYVNLGFEIVSEVYLEDGIEHHEMLYCSKKMNCT